MALKAVDHLARLDRAAVPQGRRVHQVGAARDLLNGNGRLVQPDDVTAAAAALRGLAADPESRRALGEKSRQVVRGWDYDASVEAFVAAVRDAARRA